MINAYYDKYTLMSQLSQGRNDGKRLSNRCKKTTIKRKGSETVATFGERIRELRKLQNMKQSELADILHVSKYTVSVWERDIRKPEFSTLETICDVFNVKLNYLLGASEDDSPPAMPTDEDNVEISEADNLEMVKHIARTFSRLSVRSQRIVTGSRGWFTAIWL